MLKQPAVDLCLYVVLSMLVFDQDHRVIYVYSLFLQLFSDSCCMILYCFNNYLLLMCS